jgi:spore coat protein CotH
MTAAVALLGWMACSGPGSDTNGDDSASGHSGDSGDTGEEVVDDTAGDTDDTDDHPDTGWGDDASLQAAFYDPLTIQRIDLTISEEGLAALRADPETYVEATFAHDGHTLESVGVRLKGGSSTFDDIDGKPSFKLKLDEFDHGQDYGGLDRMNLHNMTADPTLVREVIGYAAWNAAGLVAPLANWTVVYVNDVSYGLYANVEALDGGFVHRHFADPDGDLWEAGDDADFTPAGVDDFASAAGEGDAAALDEARRQIQLGDGAFYDVANVVLDMDQFLDFWAWQIVLGNDDGYPYELDDYYLYGNPEVDGRYQFVPWGLDETWDSGLEWDAVTGTVAVHCVYDTACAAALDEHVTAALSTYESLDLTTTVGAAYDLTSADAQADTRRGTPYQDVLNARTAFLTAVTGRPNQVRNAMGL